MKPARALVVDDSNVVQFKLSKMLRARGWGVHAAGSGKEALDYLASNTPDVIFMDYMMSDMTGYQTTSIITANPATASIPVIMCTGEDTVEARARAQDTGASGFIVKPVDDHVLDKVLEAVQEKAATRRPVAQVIPLSPAPPVAIFASEEDAARFVQRIAREVFAEQAVREPVAAITAATEQRLQSIAQTAASRAAQSVLADWRAEHTSTQERIERAAIAAAERAAQLAVQHAFEGIEETCRAVEAATQRAMDSAVAAAREVAEERGQQAISDARHIAESLGRASHDAATLAIGDASRGMLEAARAILQDEHRNVTEAMAASVAETEVRQVSEQVARNAIDTAAASDAAAREQLQRCVIAAEERVTAKILAQVLPATKVSNQSVSAHSADATPGTALAENELRRTSEMDHAAVLQIAEGTAGSLTDTPLDSGARVTDHVRPIATSPRMQPAVIPWLAGLTALVAYLVVRTFGA